MWFLKVDSISVQFPYCSVWYGCGLSSSTEMPDIFSLLKVLDDLKHLKRTGWLKHNVSSIFLSYSFLRDSGFMLNISREVVNCCSLSLDFSDIPLLPSQLIFDIPTFPFVTFLRTFLQKKFLRNAQVLGKHPSKTGSNRFSGCADWWSNRYWPTVWFFFFLSLFSQDLFKFDPSCCFLKKAYYSFALNMSLFHWTLCFAAEVIFRGPVWIFSVLYSIF